MSARGFALALVVGAALRIASLPLAGTYDVMKGWSYVAATRGEARLYDWAAAPEDRTLRRIDGFYAEGDYPPLALFELGLAGRIYYWATAGRFPDTEALTLAVKAPALLAEASLAALLFVVVRRRVSLAAARKTTLLFWLNPAMILSTGVHGLVDVQFVLPALAAIVAASAGWSALAGALIAAAVLTKPLAVLLIPIVAIAMWNAPGADRPLRIRRAVVGAAVTSSVIVLPIEAAGAGINMVLAVGSTILGGDLLSNAFNLWWLGGHIARVIGTAGGDFQAALRIPAEIVPISAFARFELPADRMLVRLLGSALPLTAMAWGLWTARGARDVWRQAAAAAFIVHAYMTLAIQVHENHLFPAVPLLALAAAGRPRFLPFLVATSTVLALNLNLLYGFGEEELSCALPRMATGIDLTLIVAAANCAAFVWFAVVLQRECREAYASPPRSAGPEAPAT